MHTVPMEQQKLTAIQFIPRTGQLVEECSKRANSNNQDITYEHALHVLSRLNACVPVGLEHGPIVAAILKMHCWKFTKVVMRKTCSVVRWQPLHQDQLRTKNVGS